MMLREINYLKVKILLFSQMLLGGMLIQSASAQVTADFTYVQDCEVVTFTNTSTAGGGFVITGQEWDFGDGNTSTVVSPVHDYGATDGDFTVTLTVFHDGPGQDITSQVISVWHPEASFEAPDVCLGDPAFFESSSISPNSAIVSWEWDIEDDGTIDETGEMMSWTFMDPGPHQVTLIVTNELGCTDEVTKNIVVKDPPVADFEWLTVCAGLPTAFTNLSTTPEGTITQWKWDFDDDGVYDDFSEDPVYTFDQGGVFPVKLLVVNNQQCKDSITKMVDVYSLPTASYTVTPGCPEEETAFTDASTPGDGTINSWNWDFGDGTGTSTDQNPVYTYTVNGTFEVLLTVMDDHGCQDDTLQEVIQQKPDADFLVDDVCLGLPSNFLDNSTFEPGYEIDAWQWDFGDGIGTSTDQNPVYTYAGHGVYTVQLTVSNALSCSDMITLEVLVDTLPEASFTVAPACVGLTTCFTDESVPNADTIVEWSWDFGDSNSSTLKDPCHVYIAGGTFEVTLTVTNSDGCVSVPYSETIFVSMPPDVNFTYNDVCFGDTTFFDNLTDTFGVQVANLLWDFGDPASANNTSGDFDPYHLFTGPGSFDVKLLVENEYGCMDSLIQVITIDSLPEGNFSMPDTVGVGVQFALTDLSVPHGSPIFTWFWEFGDGTSGTNINPVTHSYSSKGSYIVCLTVTDLNGCQDQHCDTVVVVGKPMADFSYASDVDLETFFTDESEPDYSIVDWFWNFGDPSTSLDTISGTATPSWQYAIEGWYSVFLEIQDSYGSIKDTTKLIYAGNAVVPEFDHYGQCIGDTTVFIDNSYSPLTSNFINWYWNFGDGTDTTYFEKIDTLYHHYEFPGIYEVKFAVSDTINGFFMTDTIVKYISVFENPVARIDTAGLNVCLGTTIQFNDITAAILDPVVSWTWDFDTGAGDSAFIKNPTFLYADTGAYNVTMAIVTDQGCSSVDTVVAHVNVSPEFDFIIENNCINSPTYFIPDYDSSVTTITKWHWNFGDELSSSNTSSLAYPTHVYDRVAEYTITMTMEAYGCAGQAEKTILVYPIPYSQFSLQANYGGVQGRTQFTNSSIYATTYLWDFGNGNTSTVPDPVEIYEYDSTYTITLISYNEYLCSDTSRAELNVFFKGLYFPTAFSPNNPNSEISSFQPKGVNLQEYLVQVFDMRGNLVWESDEVDEEGTPVESWDGYYDGRLMPQGMYIWRAAAKFRDGSIWEGQSFDGEAAQTNGVVTIVR